MNDENTSIHEFDFDLICEYFSNFERQGPGSEEETLRALSFIGHLQADSRIADLGCGTGGQTMTLAQHVPGMITGIDLIWSEGAIYNIGFERGVNEWRKYLKKGAYLAVTEASWLTREQPDEIRNFWLDAYPEIDTIPVKIAQLKDVGYVPVASFVLPEICWTDNFYMPQHFIYSNFARLGLAGISLFHNCNKRSSLLVSVLVRSCSFHTRKNIDKRLWASFLLFYNRNWGK